MRSALLLLAICLPAAAAPVSLKVREWSPRGYHIIELPLEDYVAAGLAGESSVFRSDEALKAMAVAARTYAIKFRGRHAGEGYDLCANTHCQHIDRAAVTARLREIARATAGEFLWFQGKLAFTPYSRDCGGRTEDVAAVWPDISAPYLKSHDDPNCTRSGAAAWRWNGDRSKIVEALRHYGLHTPDRIVQIRIDQRSPSGRATDLMLTGAGGAVRISASTFRFAIGRELGWNTVRSDWFETHAGNGQVIFDGKGSGHGVGLCQRGADQMGVEGRSYRDILTFYYSGSEVGVTARGFSWIRLSGDGIALFTTQTQDSGVLATAERELHDALRRTHWTAPVGIELRVYPDVDSFRNATGEPGWAAAHTQGRRIELQPARVLKSRGALEQTLRHELWHVLVESHAAAGLPLWFREGLVEYLSNPVGVAGRTRIPSDAELRNTQDAARAKQAYADAARAVADLVKRHGEATVFGWVERGLPPDTEQR